MKLYLVRHGQSTGNLNKVLKRAYNTALEISKILNIEVEKSDLLKEINFGIFENHTWDSITSKYPEEASKWAEDGLNYKFIDGESLIEVIQRAESFIQTIDDNDIIVAHSGIIQSFIIALGIADYASSWDYAIKNCDVLCVEDGKINFL